MSSIDIRKGGETIFFGTDGPVILSAGGPVRVVLESSQDGASIGLLHGDGAVTEIASGSPAEMAEAYSGLMKEIGKGEGGSGRDSAGKGRLLSTVAILLIIMIVMNVGIYGGLLASKVFESYQTAQTAAGTATAPESAQPRMPSAANMPQGILQIPGVAEILERAAAEAEAQEAAAGNGEPPILARPGFLADPARRPAPAPSAEPEAAGSAEAGPAGDGPLAPSEFLAALPAWQAIPAGDGAPQDDGTPPVPAEDTAPDEDGTVPADRPDDGDGDIQDDTPVTDELPVTAEAETDGTAGAAPEPPAGDGGADGDEAREEERVTAVAIDPETARREAREAAAAMAARGMTAAEASETLELLRMMEDADEITPEMLAELPHEVAMILRETGLVGRGDPADAPGGVPYRIIRLPARVIDAHRGPDGIPSIPDYNTWASTGNFVSIPLPGGGDVESPEDLLEFGLQP